MSPKFANATGVIDFEHLTSLHASIGSLLQNELRKSTCPEARVSAVIVGIFKNVFSAPMHGFASWTPFGAVGNRCKLEPGISRFFKILSVATNGAPTGSSNLPLHLHKKLCIHAEVRAITSLRSNLRDCFLISYSSLAPCYSCSSELLRMGTKAHVYIDQYGDTSGLELLLDKGRPVYRLGDMGRIKAIHPDCRLTPILLYGFPD